MTALLPTSVAHPAPSVLPTSGDAATSPTITAPVAALRPAGPSTAAGRVRASWDDDVLPLLDHELRTPLTVVAGWAEVLLGGDLGELPDAQRHALARIAEAAHAGIEAVLLAQQAVHERLVELVGQSCRTCPLHALLPAGTAGSLGSFSPALPPLAG